MNQLASHGFVVIASLSTTTSRGEPLPTITGLNWLLEQAEDSASPCFHHLDTTRIGALGHSEGGTSTSLAAADPRIQRDRNRIGCPGAQRPQRPGAVHLRPAGHRRPM